MQGSTQLLHVGNGDIKGEDTHGSPQLLHGGIEDIKGVDKHGESQLVIGEHDVIQDVHGLQGSIQLLHGGNGGIKKEDVHGSLQPKEGVHVELQHKLFSKQEPVNNGLSIGGDAGIGGIDDIDGKLQEQSPLQGQLVQPQGVSDI